MQTDPTRRLDTQRTARSRDAALAVLGVLLLSSDSLFLRLISADTLTVSFWRGLLSAVAYLVLCLVLPGRRNARRLLRPSGPTLLAGLIFAGSSIFFVGAIQHAPVANVLLILATAPLTTALISGLALGERVGRPTWLALAGALLGVGVVATGGLAGGSIAGHGFAVAVTVCLGTYFTILRSGRVDSALHALVFSGLFCAAASFVLSSSLAVPSASVPYLVALCLVVVPVAFALISMGPRTLPASEVALVMLLETIFGPLWVWIGVGEVPSTSAFAGGAIIIASLGGRALWTRRRAGA